jgi:hypothetical protein
MEGIISLLGSNGYLADDSYGLRVTDKGMNFIRLSQEITLNDVLGKEGTHIDAILETARVLHRMLSALNLGPVVVPSFPLLKAGVYYDPSNPHHGSRRYLTPDIIVKIGSDLIPSELGFSSYLGVEVQTSHFEYLKAKQVKYDHLASTMSPSLFPVYVVRSDRYRDKSDVDAFLSRVKGHLLDSISDVPEWVKEYGDPNSTPFVDFPIIFFNLGVLNEDGITFMNWPERPLPALSERIRKTTERLLSKETGLIRLLGGD